MKMEIKTFIRKVLLGAKDCETSQITWSNVSFTSKDGKWNQTCSGPSFLIPDRDIFRSFSIGALSEKVKKFKLKKKKEYFPSCLAYILFSRPQCTMKEVAFSSLSYSSSCFPFLTLLPQKLVMGISFVSLRSPINLGICFTNWQELGQSINRSAGWLTVKFPAGVKHLGYTVTWEGMGR